MSLTSTCGLLETPYNTFIDHLAPLCANSNIPILTSWPESLFLFKRYYPDITFKVKKWSVRDLLENFTSVLYSFVPKPSFRTLIEQQRQLHPKDKIWQKDLKLIHHFHGCSDKGYHSKWITPNSHIKDVDLLLVYGQRFEKLLADKQLNHSAKEMMLVGNYRYHYYKKTQNLLRWISAKRSFCPISRKKAHNSIRSNLE